MVLAARDGRARKADELLGFREKISFPLHGRHLRQRCTQGQRTGKGHEEAIDQSRGPSVQQACLKSADQSRVSLRHARPLKAPDLPEASQVTSKVDEKAIMDRNPKFLYHVESASVMSWLVDAEVHHTFSCCFFPMCDINVMSLLLAPSISTSVPRARLLVALCPLISTFSESMVAMATSSPQYELQQQELPDESMGSSFCHESQVLRQKADRMADVRSTYRLCRSGGGGVWGEADTEAARPAWCAVVSFQGKSIIPGCGPREHPALLDRTKSPLEIREIREDFPRRTR